MSLRELIERMRCFVRRDSNACHFCHVLCSKVLLLWLAGRIEQRPHRTNRTRGDDIQEPQKILDCTWIECASLLLGDRK